MEARADRRAGEKDEGTRLLCLFASIGSPKVRKRTSTLSIRRPMRHAKAPQSTDPPPDDLEDSIVSAFPRPGGTDEARPCNFAARG